MHQTMLRSAIALGFLVASVGSANAGWGHGGSWGGSSGGGSSGGWGGGGYGSSGGGFGSSGGYGGGGSSGGGYGGGSSGGERGGLFARLHAHKKRMWGGGSGGGSSGGYGGGSSGGNGSSGGGWGGSSGGWNGGEGMSGGMYYAPEGEVYEGDYVPLDKSSTPAIRNDADAPTDPGPMGDPANPDGASLKRADGTLVVEVPADAKIFVNDRLTSTPGQVREYVSRNLVRGYNYAYEVRAEVERDGKTLVETKRIDIRAGQNSKIAFNFAPAQDVETSITVNVPAGAKVVLGGNDTSATGETRVYRTSALSAGSQWTDYKIEVTAEIEGRQITKEQSFTLKAGDNKQLSFDFESTSVADAR